MTKHTDPDNTHNKPNKTYHVSLQPGRMEKVNVGIYKISGMPPQFTIETNPPNQDVTHKSMELVDFDTMTYELVYTVQSFSTVPLKVSLVWSGGQRPLDKLPRRRKQD